jgi:hypothetical protein
MPLYNTVSRCVSLRCISEEMTDILYYFCVCVYIYIRIVFITSGDLEVSFVSRFMSLTRMGRYLHRVTHTHTHTHTHIYIYICFISLLPLI